MEKWESEDKAQQFNDCHRVGRFFFVCFVSVRVAASGVGRRLVHGNMEGSMDDEQKTKSAAGWKVLTIATKFLETETRYTCSFFFLPSWLAGYRSLQFFTRTHCSALLGICSSLSSSFFSCYVFVFTTTLFLYNNFCHAFTCFPP